MNIQEVFIYPTAIKYDYENKNLIFNCFVNGEEKIKTSFEIVG